MPSSLDETSGPQNLSLWKRIESVLVRTWDLGFTAFGGPPVHFHIFHKRFVEKYKWIDEQTYQELFAVCQALPGPGSTKMGFCISLTYAGFIPACVSFALWSLPGAIGMFSLAVGVSRIGETLPNPVYALLSGLNSATVGIIAVAAVGLSEKAITDYLTRVIIIATGTAGLCYNALWYFPVLMVLGGIATLAWDVWGARRLASTLRAKVNRLVKRARQSWNEMDTIEPVTMEAGIQPRADDKGSDVNLTQRGSANMVPSGSGQSIHHSEIAPVTISSHSISATVGVVIVVLFFASFITIMVIRGTLHRAPVEFKIFSNLFLAGTIIFGGGPVVIPLLRQYIVAEGWVSSRDFLLGVALIQAFPGPNFNFAVFLGALAASATHGTPKIVTAILGFVGIFLPGIALATGFSALWLRLRRYRSVTALLRGVNAGAVGLVWTAVYRLWEAGYLRADNANGESLDLEPWWVVVAAVAFSGNRWFGVSPAVSIGVGGLMGLLWSYAVHWDNSW
ncbi:chromate ion transporter [Rickenella mellea]|uniref:Chromate ion transporter n=1 Tax=Rickenella mellea TaxID=50990 RepID=A0A4Y7Q5G3_9AGAM|nr:chromate ion transporter [Rickenella mellea]